MSGIHLEAAALALWAKSGEPYHPLLAHMLDTAAVASEILRREPPRTLRLYAEDWGLSEAETLAWSSFLVGLHDLGKASPIFQMAWEEGAQRVRESGLDWDEELKAHWVAHGVFTDLFLQSLLEKRGLSRRVAGDLAMALGAHHGFPATPGERKKGKQHLALEAGPWWEVRTWLMDQLARTLGAVYPKVETARPEAILRIMALASFADWVASDPALFPYGRAPSDPHYWQEAQELAKKGLDKLGWRPHRPFENKGFQELFPHIPKPNPLQEAVPALLKEVEKPVLLLVEAPMGMGKTEGALYAYHLLQRALGHRGLYVALPTQATGNGLFPRVRAFLEKASAGRVELQLQHGAALLNPEYGALLEGIHPEGVGEGEEEGVVASTWFSARRRAMLSPHGVGTLDQALLGVLRVKHHFIRLWGLMNRVVVLDEVHAYDVYTSSLLEAFLRWLKALGSSAIVMTATLPPSRRRALLSAWGAEEVEDLGSYPRVVLLGASRGPRVEALPPARGVEVELERVPVEEEALAARLCTSLPGVLGAVVNTVDRAQRLYQALGQGKPLTLGNLADHLGLTGDGAWQEVLKARPQKDPWVVGKELQDSTLVLLLHARFPAEERTLREAVALSLFGKGGPRPERAILVATQVAEQSLDLDFDLLYTDLAPMDLIFQRAGRLHRHERRRPEAHTRPRLLLGVPEGLHFGEPLHWNRVYEDFVLLATWNVLESRTALRIPEDLEALLEAVYEAKPHEFPEPLRERAEEGFRLLEARQSKEEETARNLSLSQLEKLLSPVDSASLVAELGLEDDEENPKTQRLLTRLGDPSVAVVPLFRVGEGLFLDREGRCPARLKGEVSREEAEALFRRAVRLSRFPIPQDLSQEDLPSAWKKVGLLRGLRPLEVGRVFGEGKAAFRVELDPELGVVYQRS
ncbi:CRISPR-associated endonuclease Cas3'' [Thermus sp.]|uniref:CRISPR-associated endonuclease Cas3'' n=1 Tax=Thermus sp. TaxID=275 RepID=UPI00307F6AA3